MKKIIEEKHDMLAGIVAIVAVVAIVSEMALGGFAKENIAGGIKDISGIIIDVLVLLVAASALIRKPIDFKEQFKKAMGEIQDKYSPLLVEDKKEGVIRYNIASNSNALFVGEGTGYERIFELDENRPENICFYVNKSFFDKKGGSEFNASSIANEIALCLAGVDAFKDFKIKPFQIKTNYGIRIEFREPMKYKDDIETLITLIDYTVFLFVARNKS